jgi:hypothetical protein
MLVNGVMTSEKELLQKWLVNHNDKELSISANSRYGILIHKPEPETLKIPFNKPEYREPINYLETEKQNPEKYEVLDDVEIEKAKDAKIITTEYAQTNFDNVLAEIDVITRDASLKILDAHNKAMLEYEIDSIANKIRSDIGDNIAFEMFMGDLYSEFNNNSTLNIAEKIIGKLHASKYYKNVAVIEALGQNLPKPLSSANEVLCRIRSLCIQSFGYHEQQVST